MLWERRWVTGLMNSDVRQLLINQETVCQPADWNSSPSPMCTHAYVHKHTQAWKSIHLQPIRYAHKHIYAHAVDFISLSHVSFVTALELEPVLPFPPDTWLQCAYYSCAQTAPTGTRPSLNMEISARCKFWMRPRAQTVLEIKAEDEPTVEVILSF